MKMYKEQLVDFVKDVKDSLKINLIKEGGFPRLRQIMLGQVPSVNSIGILTAENPGGQPLSAPENNKKNDELKSALRSANYSFIPIGGSYGMKEKSFVVPHMSKADAISFGNDAGQESVIWGEKISDLFGNNFFRFEFIEHGTTVDVRNVSLGDKGAQKRKDFYSEKSGRKFYIPFFDDEEKEEELSLYGRESFMESEIPNLAAAEMLVESIQKRNSFLLESNRTPKSKWVHRGMIKKELRTLERIIVYHKQKSQKK